MTVHRINMTQVSIIIVNWNTSKLLEDSLRSIYAETKSRFKEVIVVDNASTDDSCEMVRDKFPDVKLIENTTNFGFAHANNQGISIAQGGYVLLLNSDTVVLNNAISKTVSFADKHPQAAVVGCRVLKPDMSVQASCFKFPSVFNMLLSCTYLNKLFPHSHFFGREAMTWWDKNDSREIDVVCGCFMLVRQKAIEAVGMLDEQFFIYGEETDWCYRFKQAGWKVMFTPMAEIIHFGGQSSRKVKGEMLIQLRLSILKFIRKHHGWLKHKIACLLTIAFFAIRMPGWLFLYLFRGEKKMQARVRFQAYLWAIVRVIQASCDRVVEESI